MFQIVYVSTASWSMTANDLNEIVDISRANNRRLNVTGLLLYLDHCFLQILEGPKEAVLALFPAIEHDPRHKGIRVLVQREITQRLFNGWTMGFDRPTESKAPEIFQITHEAIENAVAPEKAAEIAVLLRNFYRINSGIRAA